MAAITGLRWVVRGLLFATMGLLLGAAAGRLITLATGHPRVTETAIVLGYAGALVGWLLGVGVWETWAREWLGRRPETLGSEGWQRYFRFNTDHKVIGVQYLVTFVVLLLLAGGMAMLMRTELMSPGRDLFSPGSYNTTMGLHGIIMVAVAVATIIGGFANFAVPLLIGAEDVAFPRLNALSFWIIPPVAVLLVLTPLFGGFDTGWTAYPPLAVVNAMGGLLFLLAFLTFGLSSILGGLNFIVTIARMRAPGMTWGRLPIFVWSIFAAALISLTATQFVAYGLIMIILDRVVGM
ncbi:MAG: cytochrome C oxidase subunit I, partial [SAR202 cluster bacterium]|nr:cytochrome C oxidase subunit I [SAR202 cluster bacterium]